MVNLLDRVVKPLISSHSSALKCPNDLALGLALGQFSATLNYKSYENDMNYKCYTKY